tara:strand:+ start:191 stop:1108 length:918 start_codon:yes stop_codon:yes gene_type:complete
MPTDSVVDMYLSSQQCFYEALQRATGYNKRAVGKLRETFSDSYKRRWHYKGDKKRPLSIPRRRLRMLQDFLQSEILLYLDMHDAVHGFRKKRSIITAVEPHAGAAILVCLDARQFFSAITTESVIECLRDQGASKHIATFIAAVCTDGGKLPQGTSTSPSLSNAVALPLDRRCARIAEEHDFVYTRYVDDLLFSTATNKEHAPVEAFLDEVCAAIREGGYGIQMKKFKLTKAHQKQEALGLSLNARGANGVPCRLPVRVNRAFKHRLRAALHQVETRGEAEWNASQIQGAQSFVRMVEGVPNARH